MFHYTVNNQVQLRLLTLPDAEELFALTDASRAHLRQWLPWVDEVTSPDRSKEYIYNALRQLADNKGFQVGVVWGQQLAGCAGINSIDWSNRSATVGYWLGQTFQGRGIMTAAVEAVTRIAFDHFQLNRVEIRVAVDNHKSAAIPLRLGFSEEGLARQDEWLYDHFTDSRIFAMLATDWAR